MNASASKPKSKLDNSSDHEDSAPNVDFEPADVEVADDPGRVQRIAEPDDAASSDQAAAVVTPEEPEGLSEAEFVALFIKSFAIPKILLGAAWNEFDVSDDEVPGAEAAGKSVFVLISRFMPRLLLVPQADLLTHVVLAGGFIFAKYKVAVAITITSNLKDASTVSHDGAPSGDGLDYVKADA